MLISLLRLIGTCPKGGYLWKQLDTGARISKVERSNNPANPVDDAVSIRSPNYSNGIANISNEN